MNYKSISDFFKEKLEKITSKVLEGFTIPLETKNILETVGLPINVDSLNVKFYCANLVEKVFYENEKYLIIGDDYGTKICIKQNTGEVYSIDPNNEYTPRFINSNIQCFLQFLIVYINKESELMEIDDKKAKAIMDKMKNEFLSLDGKALECEENWWSVVLEQHYSDLM